MHASAPLEPPQQQPSEQVHLTGALSSSHLNNLSRCKTWPAVRSFDTLNSTLLLRQPRTPDDFEASPCPGQHLANNTAGSDKIAMNSGGITRMMDDVKKIIGIGDCDNDFDVDAGGRRTTDRTRTIGHNQQQEAAKQQLTSAPPSVSWFTYFKNLFWHPVPPEEEMVAKCLHVSVRDLEHAIDPLRKNHLLQPSFPAVHLGSVEEMYGHSMTVMGCGTGGIVRLFRRDDGTLFAVKEFKRSKISDRKFAISTLREYAIASILHHPNVIRTVDLIIDNDRIFEVMEYCFNDLFNFICRGRYGDAEINCCFKQILQGVAYLHSIGIAHRDLKPENICVDNHARVKIIDFGLCSVFKSSGSQKTKKSHGICGSAPYIAPEEWLREPYDPQKVDIWSCGIIYITLKFHGFPWEIAAKSDPHYDAYLKALKMNSIYCIFTKFEDHRCRDVIMQMLNPDPVKRPTVQQILDSEWMMGIDVCTDCQASNNSTHKHFI